MSQAKTGNISSGGHRVDVGYFDENGLNVNNYRDENRNDNIGLSVSRNFFLYLKPECSPFGEYSIYGFLLI